MILPNYLSRRDQFDFQKCARRSTKVFYSNGFKTKGSVYWGGFITNTNHQFFREFIQKLGNIFIHHFFLTLWTWNLFPSLEISTKFVMTKVLETQVHSFHAHADIKIVFTFLKKHIHEWKHSWSKDKQKLPLVDPLS